MPTIVRLISILIHVCKLKLYFPQNPYIHLNLLYDKKSVNTK